MKETLTTKTTRHGKVTNHQAGRTKAKALQAGWIPQDTTGPGATNTAGIKTFNAPAA